MEWNFKSPPTHVGTASSSLSFTDLARQLRYVAPVMFNIGFDITDIEVELDMHG